MGIKKRDERDKLKSQSLIDSEKSSRSVAGGTGQSVAGIAGTTVTTDVQQQGSSSMYTTSSSSSSSNKMQAASSSSTSKSVIEQVVSGAHDKSQKMNETKSTSDTSAKDSQQSGQMFSESNQAAKIGSKQIENIIQEIKYIASDTVDSTKRISSVKKISDSSKSDKELREALTNFDEVAKATISDIQGSTISQTGENVSASSVQNSMSSSKMVQTSNVSSTLNSSSAIKNHQSSMSSANMTSDHSSSSAQKHSSNVVKSSNVVSSSSSSKMQSSSTSKSTVGSTTFLSDSSDIKMLKSDANLKDTKLITGGQLRDGRNHSIRQQSSTFHTDGDGGKRYSDSQSYSMAEKNAPTTEVTYDSAGNKITSTKSSSNSAQGFTTSTFQSSGDTYVGSSGENMIQSSSTAHDANHVVSSSSAYTSSSADQKTSSSTIKTSSTQSDRNTKGTVIDSTSLENYKIQDATQQAANMLTKDVSAHTITSLSSLHDSLGNTIQSTHLITESGQDVSSQQKQQTESMKTYENSSHFEQMDERSSSRKKVTDFYEQRESNASILTRKTYDEKDKRLSLIDQTIVPKDVIIQGIEDDVTNVTRTSFEAKLFNPKSKRWELVDQKTILEKDITVSIPEEIVHELEVERPDLANITTTIQLTKSS